MIIIKAFLHLLCVVLAGRRLYKLTGSSRGYLAGLFLGPFGILLVNFAPGLISKHKVNNRLSEYESILPEGINDPDDLEKVKQRKTGVGFQENRVYMPVTGGFFLSCLLGSLLYGLYIFYPVLSSSFKVTEGIPSASEELIFTIPAALIFLIPMITGLINFRTIIVCPRCGTTHKICSRLETLTGCTSDIDPRESGCMKCDYLPSRDRVITVE